MKCEDFYIEKSALLMINYFTQSCKEAKTAKSVMLSVSETSHNSKHSQTGDPSLTLRMTLPKCEAQARQNARAGSFFVLR